MYPPKQPRKLDTTLIGAIIGAVATLLAALIGGVFLLRSSNPILPIATPTSAPAVQATFSPSQVRPSATTTQSNSTDTSCTSTPAPYGGTCVFSDPLSGSGKSFHLDVASYSGGSACQFKPDAYHIVVTEGYLVDCTASDTNFSNFAFEVRMTFVQGVDAYGVYGGIVFRYGSDGSYYDFLVGITGQYYLEKVPEGVHANAGILDQGYLDGFNAGLNVPNLIAVTAVGTIISLYINRSTTPVSTVNDTSLSHGQIGLTAEVGPGTTPNGNGIIDVAFSDANVWKL